jgi:hypothetical protein
MLSLFKANANKPANLTNSRNNEKKKKREEKQKKFLQCTNLQIPWKETPIQS